MAQMNNINPQAYLNYIFDTVAMFRDENTKDKDINRSALLPRNIDKKDIEAVAVTY